MTLKKRGLQYIGSSQFQKMRVDICDTLQESSNDLVRSSLGNIKSRKSILDCNISYAWRRSKFLGNDCPILLGVVSLWCNLQSKQKGREQHGASETGHS